MNRIKPDKIRRQLVTAISAVSPRGNRGDRNAAMAAAVLREMPRPPLSETARTALVACRQREFVNDGSIPNPTSFALGEIGRVLVKARDGNSLAWLYLHLQRDMKDGARILRLNVEPASALFAPRDEDRLGADDIRFIGQWLATWKPELRTLTTADLSGHAINEAGLKKLRKILQHITCLNLRGNIFKTPVSASFFEALQKASELSEADLSVTGLDWGLLCKTLQQLPLKKLVISCENDSVGHESTLWRHGHLLLRNRHILHLDLSGQRLCEPTPELTAALVENSSLRQLLLNDCIVFSTPACLDFIRAIGRHQSLQTAGLARLSLNQDSAFLARQLLSSHCKLKTLDLSLPPAWFGEYRESAPRFAGLFEHLSGNRSLRFLSVAGHPFDEKTQKKFLSALKHAQWASLDIRGCGFKASDLATAMEKNNFLVRLRFDAPDDDVSARSIRAKLESNRQRAPGVVQGIQAAAAAIQALAPTEGIPAEVAQEIATWNWRIHGDLSDLAHLAMAGHGLRPRSSGTP